MLNTVEKFSDQLRDALKIDCDITFERVDKVVVTGMGASAISADILRFFSKKPFVIVRDYAIGLEVDENTLCIAISYSGNTEETLSCFSKIKNKCQTLAITSGGKLETLAKNKIIVPGKLQPRAATGYLLYSLAKTLLKSEIINNINLEQTTYKIESCKEKVIGLAKNIVSEITGVPIIYGNGIFGVIAKRWRQQFNENAKMLSFNFEVPECNHNELEAWEGKPESITCIFLRDREQTPQMNKRFEFMKKVYGPALQPWPQRSTPESAYIE